MLKPALVIALLFGLLACGQHQNRTWSVASQNTNRPSTPTPQDSASPSPSSQPSFQQEITFGNGLRIVPKSVELKNEQWRYQIDVAYPQIEGTNHPAILRLNRQIKERVAREYQWPISPPTKEGRRHYAKWPGVHNSVDMEYDIVLATDELLSIYFVAYHYGIGAAHSVHESFTVNYDLKSHRLLTLAGLFEPQAKHVQFISRRCGEELSKGKGYPTSDSDIDRELTPERKNFESWNVTKNGLRFNFDACKIESCAEGDLNVEIPFAALTGMLKSKTAVNS